MALHCLLCLDCAFLYDILKYVYLVFDARHLMMVVHTQLCLMSSYLFIQKFNTELFTYLVLYTQQCNIGDDVEIIMVHLSSLIEVNKERLLLIEIAAHSTIIAFVFNQMMDELL